MRKTIIYIQCRTGSTRFPGKILSKIGNKMYLELLYKRITQTKNVDEVVIITTDLNEDNDIETICRDIGAPFYRGSSNDLLDRHYQANKIFKADFVAKIPSDCPFSDPRINEEIISEIKNSSLIEYASNYHPPTFPDGLDIEITRADVLEKAWFNAKQPHEREHTFPYIWDNPELFNIYNQTNKLGNMFKTHRWTLDYPEDLEFIKAIYKEFDFKELFLFKDILKLLNEKPFLKKINEKFNGVNWYRNVPEKLKTIDKSLY
tara:strand:+ start:15527 stop:16309 length:783 start_codon:yes stop_codon:yes gene_type:complete